MEKISISKLHHNIPHYEIIKDFIKTDKKINDNFIKIIQKKLNPLKIDETDGLKLIWPKKWIHIRKSNTEPIIRFYAESENLNSSRKLILQAKKLFNN